MTSERKSLHQQYEETLRGKLNGQWWSTMELVPVNGRLTVDDDRKSDLHELVCLMKDWADGEAGVTGVYPDAVVSRFLGCVDAGEESATRFILSLHGGADPTTQTGSPAQGR